MGNSNGKPIVLTDEVNLNHFRLLRVVGKGAFGKVRIVERKDTGLTFALKYIRKDEIVRSESVRNIIRERKMLENLNHPFLCNLRYSFQDVEYLYIVVDLMNGGDLRFHISRKTFTEDAVRFWIAEIACALEYIHNQGIVHRDVKPDNILLDFEGHAHLADFNVASEFTPAKPLTSKSGTLAYLAPEVYAGKGYFSEVDWWSLGVVFYECIYNRRPFEGHHHEHLVAAIKKANPPFPVTSPPVSATCNHAISSLLKKDITLRIGAAGFETFTDEPFFRPIDFAALERKEIEPIFCPSSEKTNFDATYDLEELLLEEAPLEARARKQKPRAELREDATKEEIRADELHRMIETMFEPFNYTTAATERPPVMQPNNKHCPKSKISSPRCDHGHRGGQTQAEKSKWGSTQRSLTPGSSTRTGSSNQSPGGSPPLPAAILDKNSRAPTSEPREHFLAPTSDGNGAAGTQSTSSSPESKQRHEGFKKMHGSIRNTSQGGGVQVVLTGHGSWSGMANQAEGLAMTSDEQRRHEKPSGMLGFLHRTRGRDRSPKAKERGVIGKEGARVIVSHG